MESAPRDPLGEALKGGRTSLGLILNDVYMVDLAAHMGWDWFMIDQMFTPHDWSRADELLRAGEAAGITPVLRVQSNPWIGYDPRIAVDVTRALGIGFQYVFVSNSGIREIEDCAKVSHDWHRKALWVHPFDAVEEWEPTIAKMANRTQIIPQPESRGALDDIPAMLDLPEVSIIQFAMTDASKAIAGADKPDWYDPRLWAIVDETVKKANSLGKFVGANTSYGYDMDEYSKRIVRLHSHGVRVIMVQGAFHLFQVAIGGWFKEVRSALDLK